MGAGTERQASQVRRWGAFLLLCFVQCFVQITANGMNYTQTIGDTTTAPGSERQLRGCAEFHRVTGFEVRHGPVINTLMLQCKEVREDGKWGSAAGSMATAHLAPRGVHNNQRIKRVSCPRDTFVGNVRGAVKQHLTYRALSALSFKCYSVDAQGKRQGNGIERTLVASGGGRQSNWSECPRSGLAKAATVRQGWSVDNVKFGCEASASRPIPAAPILVSPGVVNGTLPQIPAGQVALKFRINPTLTEYVRLCVRPINSNTCSVHIDHRYTPTSASLQTKHINVPGALAGTDLIWDAMACRAPQAGSPKCNQSLKRKFKVYRATHNGPTRRPLRTR